MEESGTYRRNRQASHSPNRRGPLLPRERQVSTTFDFMSGFSRTAIHRVSLELAAFRTLQSPYERLKMPRKPPALSVFSYDT